MITVIDLNFLGVEKAIASFLVKTSEGPILIETGPHSVLPHLEKAIRKEGFELKDIKKVFLTHIHLDHAGPLGVLPSWERRFICIRLESST